MHLLNTTIEHTEYRFSTENKNARDSFCHIPFAAGPRNCIGAQLALKEIKISVVHTLRKIRFLVDPIKTQVK